MIILTHTNTLLDVFFVFLFLFFHFHSHCYRLCMALAIAMAYHCLNNNSYHYHIMFVYWSRQYLSIYVYVKYMYCKQPILWLFMPYNTLINISQYNMCWAQCTRPSKLDMPVMPLAHDTHQTNSLWVTWVYLQTLLNTVWVKLPNCLILYLHRVIVCLFVSLIHSLTPSLAHSFVHSFTGC